MTLMERIVGPMSEAEKMQACREMTDFLIKRLGSRKLADARDDCREAVIEFCQAWKVTHDHHRSDASG